MSKYILVAVDGSIPSRRAVAVAGMIGKTYGAELAAVRLAHIVPVGYLGRHLANIDFRALQVQHSEALQKLRNSYVDNIMGPFLAESENVLRQAGITAPVEKIIGDGDPADEIVRLGRVGYTLIVVGRRGMTSADSARIGGVTKHVLNAASGDVIVVPSSYPEGQARCRTILVPTDGSAYSDSAVARAIGLARPVNARIVALSAAQISGISRDEVSGTGIDYASFLEAMRRSAGKNAEMARDAAAALGCQAEALVADGVPYEEIVKAADAHQADLIVMGSHGRTALQKVFIGSVTERVIATTSCAVYVAKKTVVS